MVVVGAGSDHVPTTTILPNFYYCCLPVTTKRKGPFSRSNAGKGVVVVSNLKKDRITIYGWKLGVKPTGWECLLLQVNPQVFPSSA